MFVASKFKVLQMNLKEARIKMMNEILNGMKVSFLKCIANFNHFIYDRWPPTKRMDFKLLVKELV